MKPSGRGTQRDGSACLGRRTKGEQMSPVFKAKTNNGPEAPQPIQLEGHPDIPSIRPSSVASLEVDCNCNLRSRSSDSPQTIIMPKF